MSPRSRDRLAVVGDLVAYWCATFLFVWVARRTEYGGGPRGGVEAPAPVDSGADSSADGLADLEAADEVFDPAAEHPANGRGAVVRMIRKQVV